MRCFRLLFAAFLATSATQAAKLTPQTAAAFDRYIELTEARMKADPASDAWTGKLRGGKVRVEPGVTLDSGKKISVPDGMIQHWVGSMFMAGASIVQVKAVLQDYENYKNIYKPDVTESRLVAHQGDEFDVFLRLYKKQILTVVLNTNYHVRYSMPDQRHMFLISHSTRIAEVKDAANPDAGEKPVGDDTGFLWRLNSYWRFVEADGGVYAECEAISLSRDVPAIIGWMIKGFLEKFPKESMQNTLRGTEAAVLAKR
ncbi:MAG: hypothetical protein ABSE86_39060 [Bryobacteraceae bacterium]